MSRKFLHFLTYVKFMFMGHTVHLRLSHRQFELVYRWLVQLYYTRYFVCPVQRRHSLACYLLYFNVINTNTLIADFYPSYAYRRYFTSWWRCCWNIKLLKSSVMTYCHGGKLTFPFLSLADMTWQTKAAIFCYHKSNNAKRYNSQCRKPRRLN